MAETRVNEMYVEALLTARAYRKAAQSDSGKVPDISEVADGGYCRTCKASLPGPVARNHRNNFGHAVDWEL